MVHEGIDGDADLGVGGSHGGFDGLEEAGVDLPRGRGGGALD